jgi:hypothetical protein
MTLLELQTRMARAIFEPLTSSDRIIAAAETDYIKPNHRLTSAERLEIYSRSYWFRILDSLYDDFPGLRAVLGVRAFHRLSRAYLTDCPSRSFTLRNLGSRLGDWLERNPQYAGSRSALALDMVRLEWAHIEAFDNAAEKVLGPEDLVELGPEFRAGVQPYIRLLSLQYPVDDLRIQVNRASDERGFASNAALKQKHRNLGRRVSQAKPEQMFLAVHRLNYTVYYRRIGAEEYFLLNALRDGMPIGQAIPYAFEAAKEVSIRRFLRSRFDFELTEPRPQAAASFENSSASIDEQRSMLERWFAAWAQSGWLCAPKSKERMTQ